MRIVNTDELRSIEGGKHYHCTWCCGRGKNVDFYTLVTWYIHSKSSWHKKWWNNGYGYRGSSSHCSHTGGY